MRHPLKLVALLAVLATAACSDPAASLTAADANASHDEECIAGGYLGSGNVVPCKP